MTETGGDPLRRRLAIAAAIIWLAAALVIGLALSGIVTGWDSTLSAAALHGAAQHPGITDAMRVATFLGDWPVRLVVMMSVVVVLAVRHLARPASYLLYTVVCAWAVNAWVLKPLFARERPQAAALLPDWIDRWSLPSGHAASAAALATALGLLATVLPRRRRLLVWAACALYAAAVGASRLWLGAHWPSDVIAGWLFGAGLALALGAALAPVRIRASTRR